MRSATAPVSWHEADMNRAVDLVKKANRVVFFTGAGMSADSGISTFRNSNGFWSGITGTLALAYFGTPAGWKLTPGLAWTSYLKHFYDPIGKAQPHDGHLAIARLQKERFPDMTVITMNVDGFHSRAGNTRVAELHGTVRRNLCVTHGPLDIDLDDPEVDLRKARCPQCGRSPRPDVTLFYESLPQDEWIKAETAVRALTRRDVMVIVGTTGVVYPAASLPELAIRSGVRTIEVNLDRSPISSAVDVFLGGRAKDVVSRLVNGVLGEERAAAVDLR